MEMQVCDSAFCKILRPQTFWLSPHLLGAASTDVITGPPVQLQSTDLFCHRGPARRSPCPPAVGSALSRLWRSTRRVELAPHVAGRASFTQPSREEGERSGSEAHVTGALEY